MHIRDYPTQDSQPMCFGEVDRPRSIELEIVETKPAAEAKECEPQRHMVVPHGHVFVLGDNRYNANDSRMWGPLPKSAIKGHVVGRWGTKRPGEEMSLHRFGPIN